MKYKVLNVGDDRVLEGMLNQYGTSGWRVISVAWNGDMGYYCVVMEKEC